jgi:GntR family transcriptional regulator
LLLSAWQAGLPTRPYADDVETPGTTGRPRLRADRARQIAAVLRQRVVGGETGWMLPSEHTLQEEFEASRNTVREALAILRREGLIVRRQGVGTVVTATRHTLRVGPAEGLGKALAARGTVTSVVRLRELMRPPTDVAAALDLPDGAEAVYVERLRLLDGEPLSLDFTYLPETVGEPLLRLDLSDHDLYGLIEEVAGRKLGSTETRVEAVLADAFVSSILRVRRGAPILLLRRLTYWADGEPADVEYLHVRGDRIAVLFRGDDAVND